MTSQSDDFIYGQLGVMHLTRPFASEEEARHYEELNKKIGGLPTVSPLCSDYGFRSYDSQDMSSLPDKALVRVFEKYRTYAVEEDVIINMDRSQSYSGVQADFAKDRWAGLFNNHAPAILYQGDKAYHGTLDAFFEQGMEHIAWSLNEIGHTSYGALRSLNDGDRLVILKRVVGGDVLWEAEVSLTENQGKNSYTSHFNRAVVGDFNENDFTWMSHVGQPVAIKLGL